MYVSPPHSAFPTSLVFSDPTQWKTPFLFFLVAVSNVFPLLQPACLPRLSLSRSMSLSVHFLPASELSHSSVSCFGVATEPRADFGILHKVHNEAFPLASTPFPLTPSPLSPLNLWPSGAGMLRRRCCCCK